MQGNDYRKLFELAYKPQPSQSDWFMEHVYSDDALMMLHDERQRAVTALLLHEFDYQLFGSELSCAYICGACTHPQGRGQGYSSQLLRDTLLAAADRGCTLCAVRPHDSALYFFYEKYGFARAVYIDRQRYTALHTFAVADDLKPAEVCYEDFHRLELVANNTVVHSRADFSLIIDELQLDNGVAAAAARDGVVCSMAFGTDRGNGVVNVRALFAADGSESAAADAVLAQLRDHYGEAMMVVDCFPGRPNARLEPCGMLRVLDVPTLLQAVAAADPALDVCIAVHDSLIGRNNGFYRLAAGECRPCRDRLHPDLDVSVDVLVRILSSSPSIASIIGLPGDYARLPLMF